MKYGRKSEKDAQRFMDDEVSRYESGLMDNQDDLSENSTGNYVDMPIKVPMSDFDVGIEEMVSREPSNYYEKDQRTYADESPISQFDVGMSALSQTPSNYVERDPSVDYGYAKSDEMSTYRPEVVSDRRFFNNDPRSAYGQEYPADEKGIYPALSVVKPNAAVADTSPLDWGGYYDDNRNQGTRRALVRKYVEDLYNKAGSDIDLVSAGEDRDSANKASNIGQALEGLFRSRSMAYGGQGVNRGFWQGLKEDASQTYKDVSDRKKQAVSDYLTKHKLGSQAVEEMYATTKAEREMAANDPRSEISASSRAAFKQLYPEQSASMGKDLDGMSAAQISDFAKLSEASSLLSLKKQAEMRTQGQQTFENVTTLREQKRKEDETKAKINRPLTSKAGESPEKKALLKAQAELAMAKAEAAKKGGGLPISTQRAIEKEKKSIDEFDRGKKGILEAYDQAAKIGMISGYSPSAFYGKREEHNALNATIASKILEVVPGIRSDKDYQNVIQRMLPQPYETNDSLLVKRSILENWLDSRKPSTPSSESAGVEKPIKEEKPKELPKLSPRDQEAYDWATDPKNRYDKRADEILKKLGR